MGASSVLKMFGTFAEKAMPKVAEALGKAAPAATGVAKKAVGVGKSAAKTVAKSGSEAGAAAKAVREAGGTFKRSVAKGASTFAEGIGGGVLDSSAVHAATGRLAEAASGTGVGAKAAGVASKGLDRLVHSRAGKIAAATGLGATALYATGNGAIVDNTVEAAGNIVKAGGDLLTHAPEAAAGACGAVGSGMDAVSDLAATVTGVISDVTAGDFGNIANRLGSYVSEHPMATAAGLGGGALLLGGGGIVGKVAMAGIGFVAAKTVMEKVAMDKGAEQERTSGASTDMSASIDRAIGDGQAGRTTDADSPYAARARELAAEPDGMSL